MNQAVWDVNKAVSAVRQARDQFESVLKLEKLTREVLEVQQQRFNLASAALAIAQGHVVRARAAYARKLIQYEQVTGTILDRNNIELSEAVDGVLHR
jgi:outer membrane protein TolC